MIPILVFSALLSKPLCFGLCAPTVDLLCAGKGLHCQRVHLKRLVRKCRHGQWTACTTTTTSTTTTTTTVIPCWALPTTAEQLARYCAIPGDPTCDFLSPPESLCGPSYCETKLTHAQACADINCYHEFADLGCPLPPDPCAGLVDAIQKLACCCAHPNAGSCHNEFIGSPDVLCGSPNGAFQ